MSVITEFQGEYRWLSNFWPARVELDGMTYPSVEHAYMAAKSPAPEWRHFCASTAHPGVVKRASRDIVLVQGWDGLKISVMAALLRQKFATEPMRSKLIATGSAHLQEGNRWGDRFWGVDLRLDPPRGQNVLGQLLMQIRSELEESV